jgi:hypothetical protein
MKLRFLDREEERSRLRRLLARREGTLAVLYGRRRCGKSRLLHEVIPSRRSIYHVGDDRESALQRASLAVEVARILPGFDAVVYPDWGALFARFWDQAAEGTVLALDEFPTLASAAGEVPSLLQKHVDRRPGRPLHLVLAGSSQRLMQGLVLDRSAPLFGRADEVLKIGPLPAGWIQSALGLRDPVRAVEAVAVWGGIPRYWELAAEFADLEAAVRALVLSPLGVLHDEPGRLLLDDLRDTTQAASILSLIGQGCHRLSEIAGRLGKPATSLTRPLQRLLELDLVSRDVPFGTAARDARRTLYRIGDPFLRFWFRYVEPSRSLLEARRITTVAGAIARTLPGHVAGVWEDLARASVPWLRIGGLAWKPARRFWGPGADRRPMEIDLVAESEDGTALLLGEARWTDAGNLHEFAAGLRRKAERFPLARSRRLVLALWVKRRASIPAGLAMVTPAQVLSALRRS